MDRARFEELVARAIESLPEELAERLENVDVVVEDYPTREQIEQSGIEHDRSLLGLYEGVPLTERGSHYGMVVPDKITVFQKVIEKTFRNEDEMADEIRRVVQHEIAHHFGISDARLEELENDEET